MRLVPAVLPPGQLFQGNRFQPNDNPRPSTTNAAPVVENATVSSTACFCSVSWLSAG